MTYDFDDIPKIIHQTWKTNTLPEHWQPSQDGWKALEEKGWTYILWTDDMIDAFIAEKYPWFLEQFRGYKHGIQRADAFRPFVLHDMGGIYVDTDIAPKENFEAFYELYKKADVALPQTKPGNAHGGQHYTNSFMMSKPKSAFWPVVWKLLQNPYQHRPWKKLLADMSYHFRILFSTGPGTICDAVDMYDGPVHNIPSQLAHPGSEKSEKTLYNTRSRGDHAGRRVVAQER